MRLGRAIAFASATLALGLGACTTSPRLETPPASPRGANPVGFDTSVRTETIDYDEVARAYRETGAEAVEGFRKVLLGLLDPVERLEVDKRVRGGGR